jgi:hypothetical protein
VCGDGVNRGSGLHIDLRSTCVASLVAQNRGYSWGISRALRAALLPKPLVESRCDDEVPPRNEKVIGSIPIGGSTQTPRSGPTFLARGVCNSRLSIRRGAREATGALAYSVRSVPEVLVDQVAVQVRRHGRRGMAQDALNHLRVGSCCQPDRRRSVAKIVHPRGRYAADP